MFYPLFYSKTHMYSPKTFLINITEIQSGDHLAQNKQKGKHKAEN